MSLKPLKKSDMGKSCERKSCTILRITKKCNFFFRL